ncbi:MAG: hypothetical protein LBH41_00795 [Rickettsiales bacterium]|jgi:hypothetical protein|nr:hypothetical protein [Rickettsiales bacterium]
MNETPLAISMPSALKDASLGAVYIYFPNPKISLDRGRVYGGRIYRVDRSDIGRAKILYPGDEPVFQFLVMVKPANRDEIVSDAHFVGTKIYMGPFVSASRRLADRRLEISLESFPPSPSVVFEIEGLPDGARMENAAPEGDSVWRVKGPGRVTTLLPERPADGLRIGITAKNVRMPRFPSHFNLVVPPLGKPGGYRKNYREVKIDIAKMALSRLPRAKNLYITIKGPEREFCVQGFRKIGDKWISRENVKSIVLNSYDKANPMVDFLFGFVRERGGKMDVSSEKHSVDFSRIASKPRDYAKCVDCVNARKCPMFKEFMDYIGNDTILRQIVV